MRILSPVLSCLVPFFTMDDENFHFSGEGFIQRVTSVCVLLHESCLILFVNSGAEKPEGWLRVRCFSPEGF